MNPTKSSRTDVLCHANESSDPSTASSRAYAHKASELASGEITLSDPGIDRTLELLRIRLATKYMLLHGRYLRVSYIPLKGKKHIECCSSAAVVARPKFTSMFGLTSCLTLTISCPHNLELSCPMSCTMSVSHSRFCSWFCSHARS